MFEALVVVVNVSEYDLTGLKLKREAVLPVHPALEDVVRALDFVDTRRGVTRIFGQ
jgi:hypothetical protein